MKNLKKKNHFTISFEDKAILGTKRSITAAGKGYGPEYNELCKKMTEWPDFELVELPVKSRKDSEKPKKSTKGITKEFINDYVKYIDTSLFEKLTVKKAFAKKNNQAEFPMLRKWFVDEVIPEIPEFDIKELKDTIRNEKEKEFGQKYRAENAPAA